MLNLFSYIWTVLFETVRFSISIQFSSIWPIDWTLSGATTPSPSGPGSDGNKGVFRMTQNSNIIRVSLSDTLMSYPEYSLEEGILLLSRDVGIFYSPGRLGWFSIGFFLWLETPTRQGVAWRERERERERERTTQNCENKIRLVNCFHYPCSHVVVANVLYCELGVSSSNSSRVIIMFTFGLILMGMVWRHFSPLVRVK